MKGRDRFLYRAVDSTGQTIDFLLTDRRDAAAAKRFFRRALLNEGNSMPRVINVDKNPAYPRAVEELKREGTISRRCRLRQCKYLNNVVEQSHRNVKRRTWLAKGYGSLPTAWRTLRGIEAMEMVRKGRVRWVAKGDPWPRRSSSTSCSLCKCTLDQQFFTPDDFRNLTTKNACRLGEREKPARYRRASAPSVCSPFSRESAIPFILASFPRNARWRR